ncbi:aspartate/glutamate racemase family protein [Trinickia dinghuensis]|uniref:Arylsulfatase n=1 Tax=Trinickia dinghuensis TaxID=2291023 RepID=A0A3D8K5V1_9BURK|nr:aspartate/glutamate racemase family protein [Trinickia dinghuensis]RDV00600.1 arylsulfatase [Trinickia dinghuensis]
MSGRPRIGLIHATALAMAPIAESFARLWPEAMLHHVLDESLTADLAAAGGRIEAMTPRVASLARYVVDAGAGGVLFTCSAFGPAIEVAREQFRVPVLKPNEAMIDEALALGDRICLVATFEPALAPIEQEFHERAHQLKRAIVVDRCFVPGAIDALRRGDEALHDRLVAEACSKQRGGDVLCFAQFSMTSARTEVEKRVAKPVLTTPDSAVQKLKSRLAA